MTISSIHSRLFAALLCASLPLAIGCGGEPSSAGTGDDQNVTEGGDHAAAVVTCDAERDAALDAASSQAAMNMAASDWASCVAAANDAALPRIEQNLAEIESPAAGHGAERVAAYRGTAEPLCGLLGDASSSFGGSLNTLERIDCSAGRERALASLIDAYADLGGDNVAIPEVRGSYAACYGAFDAAMDDPEQQSTMGMLEATYTLASCIEAEVDAVAAKVAGRIVENRPESTLSEVEAALEARIDEAAKAGREVCGMLADASSERGGSLSRLSGGMCYVNVVTQIGAAVRSFNEEM